MRNHSIIAAKNKTKTKLLAPLDMISRDDDVIKV